MSNANVDFESVRRRSRLISGAIERLGRRSELRELSLAVHEGTRSGRAEQKDWYIGESEVGNFCGSEVPGKPVTQNFQCGDKDFNCTTPGGFQCGQKGTKDTFSNCKGASPFECDTDFDCASDLYTCQEFDCKAGTGKDATGYDCSGKLDFACGDEFECKDDFDCTAGHIFLCSDDHECVDDFSCNSSGDPACSGDYNFPGGGMTAGDFLCGFEGGNADTFDCSANFDCESKDQFNCTTGTGFDCAGDFDCKSPSPYSKPPNG